MRDLFSAAAPARRDQGTSDAQRRASKAANVPVFAQASNPLRTMVVKAERLAADVERQTRERITARKQAPTLLERKGALPAAIAAKTEGPLGVSIPAAELLARVVAYWVAHREPAMVSPSSVAAATGCTEEEAHRQIGELQVSGLIIAVTDALGRAGWRPDPVLLRK